MRAQSLVEPMAAPQKTLIQLLVDRAAEPNRLAAKSKRNGVWEDVTWGQVLEDVKKLSAALVAEGVRPGDRVAIFGNTTLQWVLCDLAINAARAVTVPIYASNTADEAKYILTNSDSVLCFVDSDVAEGKNAGRATRLRQRQDQTPQVRRVVVMEGSGSGGREVSWTDFMRTGEESHRANARGFDDRVRAVRPDEPACFIYTSGTTGEPKGVILTHANWAYEAEAVSKIGLMEHDDSVLLFLPLAHSFAQVVKAAWLGLGFQMIFAESVDKLLANLAETRPSILPAVPRVYEKVFNNVVQNGSSAPGVKGRLFRWAFKMFDEYVEARKQGKEYSSLGFSLARKLVFSKVNATLSEKMGGRMRLFISGGAPLSLKIGTFFELIGFKVLEGYGLTETSAATCVNRPEKIKAGTVGPPVPGTEIRIASDGEILIKGPGVMKGYYKNDAATAEVLDPDGWFHSGDIGELDADGYVKITDRKKDIIVTAGGKNVAPQNIENMLKTFPLISQSVVHGDKRKYLSVLICVNEEAARKLITDKGGQPPATYAELSKRPEIREEVQRVVDTVNAEMPSYSTLKRFTLMEHDFTIDSGELTPKLSVKRKYATQKYKPLLDAMYDGESVD